MSDMLNHLNAEQKAAVLHDQGPLLIVAGAGTGKTTVITEKIAYLVLEKKLSTDRILALTFTDKAAGEMTERAEKLLPYGYVDLWVHTFHAFAEKILHDHGLEIGLPSDFKVLDQTNQWLLVRKNLSRFSLDYYRPLGNPTKFIHALISHFSRAKDENISPQDYLAYAEELKMNADSAEFVRTVIDDEARQKLSAAELSEALAREILRQEETANAYHTYQQLFLENNSLDFGDLILYLLKLFRERKNILARYRAQFKYILVDEFQDTNFAQYELLKLLATPDNNLMVVGDDDQSIYKFRGASISNILQFKDDYPQAKEIFLTANYRSRQNILDLSYKFIQNNNPYRLEIKLAGDKKLSKKLLAQVPETGELLHLFGRDLAEEARLVAQKIIKLYNENEETDWSDFAILVRANASADDFCYVLEQAKIPYDFVASRGLYAKKIVLDILAYLKLLDDYHEGPAMLRVLRLPFWTLGHDDLSALGRWREKRGLSLFEALKQKEAISDLSEEGRKVFALVLGLLEKHAQLARQNKNISEIIQAFLNDSGYLKFLTAKESVSSREEIGYLNQFFQKARDFELANADKTLKAFLDLLELELEAGEAGPLKKNLEDQGPDTVKIMTVHAAKGLEFKYVFIANLVDQRFPAVGRREAIELPAKLVKEITPEGDIHLQEERRLFYVAMTRAKNGLYFTSAEDYGGARKKKPSRFLTELAAVGLALNGSNEPKADEETVAWPIKAKSQAANKIVLPAKFSFTQLKNYETCPYQYYLAHILKIPVKGKAAFSFGKSIHLTMQRLFLLLMAKNQNQQNSLFPVGENQPTLSKISQEEALKIYEESFIDEWYLDAKTREDYFERGRKFINDFYERYRDNWPRVKYLEKEFHLPLGEYSLFGRIDRIDEMEGGVKIIDYKTGRAKSKLQSEDKEQLLLYQLAAQEALDEKVADLAFYYFENGGEISFLGQEKELQKFKEKIIGLIDRIKDGDFSATPDALICQYCDFNGICEFRKF